MLLHSRTYLQIDVIDDKNSSQLKLIIAKEKKKELQIFKNSLTQIGINRI